MKKYKLAFFVSTLNAGGVEHYLLRFLQHYSGQIQATVFCKSGKLGDLEANYRETGAQLVPFRLGYFDFAAFSRLRKRLQEDRFDAVCDFTGNFAGPVLAMAHKAGIGKRVAFYRGSDNHFKEDALRLMYNALVRRLTLRYATDILSNSEAALHFFYPGQYPGSARFGVIRNGIDAARFRSTTDDLRATLEIPEDAFVVGHVGRYNVAKNHRAVMEVAKRLCGTYPDMRFVICGEGVPEHLLHEVQASGLEGRILLLGYRSDVIRVLNTLDCFYFPSLTEGQPNALIEAMVAGLPVVASDIAPIREVLPERYHSQLVAPHDHAAAYEKIMAVFRQETQFPDMKDWAIATFDAGVLFGAFFKRLVS